MQEVLATVKVSHELLEQQPQETIEGMVKRRLTEQAAETLLGHTQINKRFSTMFGDVEYSAKLQIISREDFAELIAYRECVGYRSRVEKYKEMLLRREIIESK